MKKKKIKEEAIHRIEIPNAILLGQVKEAVRSGHTATINVKGYSMRPFLEHCRDKVQLAPIGDLKVGDAVLAEISKDIYVLHRVFSIKGDCVTLMGDGNLKGMEQCRKENVLGIVTSYVRNGKFFYADNPYLKYSVRVWRKLLPVRRYLLFIYKINLKLSNILK